jgi:hypothetical protein
VTDARTASDGAVKNLSGCTTVPRMELFARLAVDKRLNNANPACARGTRNAAVTNAVKGD